MTKMHPVILCKTQNGGRLSLRTDGKTITAIGTFYQSDDEPSERTFRGAAVEYLREKDIPEVWLTDDFGEDMVEIHRDYACEVEDFLILFAPYITSITGLYTDSWYRSQEYRDQKQAKREAEMHERNEGANLFLEQVKSMVSKEAFKTGTYQKGDVYIADEKSAPDENTYDLPAKSCESCGCIIAAEHRFCDTCKMQDELVDDMKSIVTASADRIETKYRKGAKEHGGRGWEMGTAQLIANAQDEVADLTCYLTWLDQHLDTITEIARNIVSSMDADNEKLVEELALSIELSSYKEAKALLDLLEGKPNRG